MIIPPPEHTAVHFRAAADPDRLFIRPHVTVFRDRSGIGNMWRDDNGTWRADLDLSRVLDAELAAPDRETAEADVRARLAAIRHSAHLLP